MNRVCIVAAIVAAVVAALAGNWSTVAWALSGGAWAFLERQRRIELREVLDELRLARMREARRVHFGEGAE